MDSSNSPDGAAERTDDERLRGHRASRRDWLLVTLILCGLWAVVLGGAGAGAAVGSAVSGGMVGQVAGGFVGLGVALLVVMRWFMGQSWIETGCLLGAVGVAGTLAVIAF